MMFLAMINLGHVLNVDKNIIVLSTPYQEAFLSRKWLKSIKQNKNDQNQCLNLAHAQSIVVRLKFVS